MKTRTFVGLGLGGLLLLALGCLWHGWRTLQLADASLAAITLERASVEKSLLTVRARIAAHRLALSALEAARQRAHQLPTSPSDQPSSVPGPSGQSLATLLESNPRLMDLYLKSFRAGLAERFGWIYEKLGFTSDQIGHIEDLMTAHEQETVDLRAAAAAQGLPMSDPGITALRRQANQQYQATVIAAVGDSAGQQLSQYAAPSAVQQGIINNLAEMVALSPAPMTYATANELAPILAAVTASSSANGGSAPIDWTKVTTQAAGILSDAQLQVLRSMASLGAANDLVRKYYAGQASAK